MPHVRSRRLEYPELLILQVKIKETRVRGGDDDRVCVPITVSRTQLVTPARAGKISRRKYCEQLSFREQNTAPLSF